MSRYMYMYVYWVDEGTGPDAPVKYMYIVNYCTQLTYPEHIPSLVVSLLSASSLSP